jgi:hypothetical protein
MPGAVKVSVPGGVVTFVAALCWYAKLNMALIPVAVTVAVAISRAVSNAVHVPAAGCVKLGAIAGGAVVTFAIWYLVAVPVPHVALGAAKKRTSEPIWRGVASLVISVQDVQSLGYGLPVGERSSAVITPEALPGPVVHCTEVESPCPPVLGINSTLAFTGAAPRFAVGAILAVLVISPAPVRVIPMPVVICQSSATQLGLLGVAVNVAVLPLGTQTLGVPVWGPLTVVPASFTMPGAVKVRVPLAGTLTTLVISLCWYAK